MSSSPFSLAKNKRLAMHINTTMFHTKMIDYTREMLRETSDMSIYW